MKPIAWWRLHEFSGPIALDASRIDITPPTNRVFSFISRTSFRELCVKVKPIAPPTLQVVVFTPTVNFERSLHSIAWIWNGMPIEGREVTGWILSKDHNFGLSPNGNHLGIGGQAGQAGD